ncbi:MAG: hypothetical protein JXA38_03270 [Methanosarcinaceae archaeon]|nr:hypothetical protein [Methanosarcinaceae archaeon]
MEYDALFSFDGKKSGFEYMPTRLIARAIDYARFGRLFLNEGNWNGNQIIFRIGYWNQHGRIRQFPVRFIPAGLKMAVKKFIIIIIGGDIQTVILLFNLHLPEI